MQTEEQKTERIRELADKSPYWSKILRQTEELYPDFAPPVSKDEVHKT